MLKKLSLLIIGTVLLGTFAIAETVSPFSTAFPDVETIKAEDVYEDYEDYEMVDVRSKFEFAVLHTAGAHHYAILQDEFLSQIKQLRKNSSKDIVIYSDASVMLKAYQAAARAQTADIDDVYVMEVGVNQWAEVHPDKTVLMGQSPSSQQHYISSEQLREKLNSPAVAMSMRMAAMATRMCETRTKMMKTMMAKMSQNANR